MYGQLLLNCFDTKENFLSSQVSFFLWLWNRFSIAKQIICICTVQINIFVSMQIKPVSLPVPSVDGDKKTVSIVNKMTWMDAMQKEMLQQNCAFYQHKEKPQTHHAGTLKPLMWHWRECKRECCPSVTTMLTFSQCFLVFWMSDWLQHSLSRRHKQCL